MGLPLTRRQSSTSGGTFEILEPMKAFCNVTLGHVTLDTISLIIRSVLGHFEPIDAVTDQASPSRPRVRGDPILLNPANRNCAKWRSINRAMASAIIEPL
jgi:hypothetical protein